MGGLAALFLDSALNPAYFTQTLAFFILGLAAFSVRSTYKWLSKRK